jgi:ketosteroid isomerase-like protein
MSNIEEELAIRSMVSRYIDAVNRYDQADWTATWSENATWNLAGMELKGREMIVGAWVGAMASFEFAIMSLNSGTVEIDGDTATGRWYLTEHLKPKDDDAVMVLGVYDDSYVRENGNWVFSERIYNIIYRGPADYSGEFTPYRPD